MANRPLTLTGCKTATAPDKPIKLFDGGGLYLHVSPSGSKVWRMSFRLDGRPQTATFGAFPEVSLVQARKMRDALKEKQERGLLGKPKSRPLIAPPAAPPSPDLAQVRLPRNVQSKINDDVLTVRRACQMHLKMRQDLTARYLNNIARAFEMHLFPHLGDLAIAELSREQLLAALLLVDQAGRADYVRKIRMWFSQVLDWAVARDYVKINVANTIDPKRVFSKKSTQHFASLEISELPAFLDKLNARAQSVAVLATWFMAYTWVRTTEVRLMTWSEVTDGIWRIPGARMKRRRDHMVVLPPQALEILAHLRKLSHGEHYVFRTKIGKDEPMSENAVLSVIYHMGYKGRMTGHGFRSVASTWAHECGYSPDVIERQLAHAPEDRVRAAYNRAEYLPQRTQMLIDFANWIDAQAQRRPPGSMALTSTDRVNSALKASVAGEPREGALPRDRLGELMEA